MSQQALMLAHVAAEAKDWTAAAHYCDLALEKGERAARELLAIIKYKQLDFKRALELLEAASQLGEISRYGTLQLIGLHLLAGDQRRGWELLRDSCRDSLFGASLYSLPRWSGEPLEGKSIVAWGATFGDDMLAVRYIPSLAAAGAKVYLNCRPPLVQLFQSLRGIHQVLPFDVEAPGADFHVNTLELPFYFGASEGRVWPDFGAYLSARSIQLQTSGKRVGLVWGADSRHLDASERTAALADMTPLASVPGVRLYSLQVGTFAAQLSPPPSGMSIEDLSPGYPDFSEQASQIMGLDLVITVDTAVANLAGALGAPVWVAVPYVPNWRWGMQGNTTPWYPSARVYRQSAPGDWRSVFRSMAGDLAKLPVRLT